MSYLAKEVETSPPAPPSAKQDSCNEVLVTFLSVFRMPSLWLKGLAKTLDAKYS